MTEVCKLLPTFEPKVVRRRGEHPQMAELREAANRYMESEKRRTTFPKGFARKNDGEGDALSKSQALTSA